jgi:zinc/manganese transport system substrate-binding protein
MRRRWRATGALWAVLAGALLLSACGPVLDGATVRAGTIAVVAAEDQYGDVASQVGGRFVSVASVESTPNVDPHEFEVSPAIARAVSGARVVVENGLGYDAFMAGIVAASPDAGRRTLDAQHLLGLPDTTPNPHLWYSPRTMVVVASALAAAFASIQPAHASYFRARAEMFDRSLAPLQRAIAAVRSDHHMAAVATTEPVADYLLAAMGLENRTPWRFQADVMNGVDPSAQDEAFVTSIVADHAVGALVYNRQVTDQLTQGLLDAARAAHVPTVGVTETMPVGDTYQHWMLAAVSAVSDAFQRPAATGR